MYHNTDFPDQPAALRQPPHTSKLSKPITLILAILLTAAVAGTGGYLLGRRNNQLNPLSLPSPTPQAKISATITQPYYDQYAPYLSPLPTTPLSAEKIPTCTLTGHNAETADWKTYTNTKYHYSYKYPTEANAHFNFITGTPFDSNDGIDIKDPNDINWNPVHGRWIVAFDLSIATLANYPEEFNSYKDLLKKVYETKGEYMEGGVTYRQLNILNQPAVITFVNNYVIILYSFIKDNVLYNIELNREIFPLSCQILSTFKLTDQ